MTEKLHHSAEQTSAAHDEANNTLSRRRFLNTAGCAAVGGLMVAAGTTLFTGGAKAEDAPAAPPLPWKYVELDPLEAGKRGYKAYLEKGG